MNATWRTAAIGVIASAALTGCSRLVESSNCGIEALESAPGPAGVVATSAKYAGWLIAGPADVAAVPVAGIAWASPWGDLATFADVATAPSIGAGYALDAIVGGLAYASLAWWWSEEGAIDLGEIVPWGFIVDHFPAAAPRDARPLEKADSLRYAVPEGADVKLAREIAAREGDPERERCEPIAVRLDAYGIRGSLELSIAESDEPRTLVFLTPPSQATFAAQYLARRYVRDGVHAAVIVPDGDYLDPALDASGLEESLRRGVVAARTIVAALAARTDVKRVVYLGISAGGIMGSLLVATEPRIERAVLVLPGGDLPKLITTSEENTVRAYRDAWTARGLSPGELELNLRAALATEPLRLAPAVDPRQVLLFLADSDTLVPLTCGLELRAALGEPETFLLSGEHEVAGCCFGFVLRKADEFLLDE